MKRDRLAAEELGDLIPHVVELARAAGERILAIYETEFDVTHKGDASPLTAADLAAHEAIVAGLSRLTPHWPVLSEESAAIPFSERRTWYRYWLVDPLDGTREFVKRNGEFTVNIALIEDHRPVLGVIQVPVTGLIYQAARGLGARKHEPGEAPVAIHTRPLSPEGPIVVAGSRSHGNPKLERFLAALGRETEVFPMGSSLKSCLVAEGKADLYARLGPTSEWDTAAAQAIVEEAGGVVMDLAGEPLAYNTKDGLLNPHFLVAGDPTVDWRPALRAAGLLA